MILDDNIKTKGHFCIQQVDPHGNVLDEYKQDNMIMQTSRVTMAELLANISNNLSIDKIVLGTMGHVNEDILIPKDPNNPNDGFIKDRNRLFSEYISVDDNQTHTYNKNDIIKYVGSTSISGVSGNYYRYIDDFSRELDTNSLDLNGNYFEDLGTEEPYSYEISFQAPGVSSGDLINISEPDYGSTGTILQGGSDVTYTINISTTAANNQKNGVSIFTEAALYAGDNIFSMKTFKAKIKDSAVLLRVIWTISF